jgi:hypothetical protein
MLKDASRRKFDIVVTWAFDRLGIPPDMSQQLGQNGDFVVDPGDGDPLAQI